MEPKMPALDYPHIEFSAVGVPMIAGTQTKVVEIVLDRLAHHWDADEIQRQHPHLTLAQIYSALAYYHDHQEAIDDDIANRLRREQEITSRLSGSDVRAKLQSTKAKRRRG
jgi:uncharacterized protein (DUF433 family)